MSKSKQSLTARQFIRNAAKIVNLKKLFPKNPPDLRKNPTDYQLRKIKKAITELEQIAGGRTHAARDFVRLSGRGQTEYLKSIGMPEWSRVVFLPGGEKVNSNARIVKNTLIYDRGNVARAEYPLKATTAETLEKDLKAHRYLIETPGYTAHLGTHGGVINRPFDRFGRRGASTTIDTDAEDAELFEDYVLGTFEKYARLAEQGEYRPDDKKKRKAAHPSRWGLKIIMEAAR